ncbi:hypothetical protein M23134_01823 [Microscilla marina ATCC 23134]|uniref:Uncharacterized protein n=1 Tax=Microscilla marina ATCC 23134 TaxID=313606 RepID=A1ZBZ2_MICM2|nr:hypothetical protein M23134_01823 [Microscilla marina ATCC 23134]
MFNLLAIYLFFLSKHWLKVLHLHTDITSQYIGLPVAKQTT